MLVSGRHEEGRPVPEFTFITSYYSQPLMLQRQLEEWAQYPPAVSFILVDDGSPIPALPVVQHHASKELQARLRVYRILQNIPWNREQARNLGAQEAKTQWIIQTDIDHILHAMSAEALLRFVPTARTWYRFNRYRVGAADETRRKDALPDACEFGPVKPHGDSFLIERELFLQSPYDLAYVGILGGGTPFQARMEARAPVQMLPGTICLHVYTRHVIPDASVTGLSRDTGPYARLRREKERRGDTEPDQTFRAPWERQL